MTPVRLRLLAFASLLALARAGEARPVPTIHPGGAPSPPDTLVLEFPVRKSPSLLSLQAVAPLAPLVARREPASATVLRAGDPLAPRATPEAPASRSALAARDAAGRDAAASDALVVTGAKSFAIEVGRGRDASLDQTLDLVVRGRVAGDVEVSAMLSDQRLPFEPDGSTRELEELDRIALSVRAPQGGATLGDFRLEGLPGEFARVTRALEGVRGDAVVRGTRWDVAAASAKGERRSLELRGEEGKQGPYPLLARGADAAATGIVAGSETVWLDGAKLRRGADLDYVMDYGAGTVTFTIRRPIGAASRIAVDFEAAAGRYRRSFYAASTRRELERGTWYASYLREGDDAQSPLGAALTSEDRRALGAIGDSTDAPLPSGVRHVGAGNGSYGWDPSDPARPHWIWLGPARGDYDVEFALVGAGRGDYADTTAADGTRFYRYMGEALGSFEPGRALAVPRENALFDVGGSVRLLGALGVEGEIARSGFDRNALSSIDDGDNAGTAARMSAKLDPRALRLFGARLGSVGLLASFRARDERFASMDRLDPSFEGERWNQGAAGGGERRQEVAITYDPVAALGLRADLGMRRLSGGSTSIRRAASLDVRSFLPGAVRWEEARNRGAGDDGLRSRVSIDLARDRGTFLPKLSAADERVRGQHGDSADARRSRLWTAGVGVEPGGAHGAVRLRASAGWRRDESVTGAGAAAATEARTWEGGIAARAGGAFALDASMSRRRAETPSGPQAADLAQLMLTGGRAGGPLTSELRYDVTQLREASVTRTLVPVGPGSGSYDEFGRPRLGGGYEMTAFLGDPTTRSRATAQLRLDAYPGRAGASRGRGGVLRALGLSSYLRLETLSSLPLGRIERALRLGDYLAEGSTIRGSLNARQTVEYLPAGARFDVRLEAGVRRDVSGEVAGLRSRAEGADARLRVRRSLPLGLRAAAAADLARNEQSTAREDGSGSSSSVIRGRGYELELSRALRGPWTLSLQGRHRRDADLTRGGFQDAWSVGPLVRCAGARLRLDGRASYGRLDQRGDYAPSGRYLEAPRGARGDLELLGEYRAGDRISLAASWTGSRVEGRSATTSGRLELRSTF